jgi:hypothetical protein
MIAPETDGFKVFSTWNHQGAIVFGRSCDPSKLGKFDAVSDPGAPTPGPKGRASRAKDVTADARKAARNRWQNR